MGQFSNSFAKHFSYLCEHAIRFDLSCSYCEYPAIFRCLHCSPSCFDPDSLLLAYLWLGLSWIDCISANKSFSSSKTSSRKPYTSSKQQERQKHSVEITINVPPRAVVVAGGVPLWRASWPRVVSRSSSGPVALGAPVGFSVAVVPSPTPGAVAPGFTGWLRGARGGRPRTRLIVPAAGPCRIKGAGRAPRRTRSGPRDGVVPGGSLRLRSWAACAAVVWRVWTRSLMRPVSRTVRLATGDSAGAPGLFRVDAGTAHFGSEDATPGSRACVRVRAMFGRVGRAGLPGAFWCASPSLWLFLVRSLLVRPPPGWGCPVCGCCWFFFFLLPSPFSPSLRPRCVLLCVFSGPGCLGPWRLVPPPLFFASPPTVCPVVSCFARFPAWGAVGLGVLLPPPPSFPPPCLLSLAFPAFRLPWAPAPPLPPPFFSLGFLLFLFLFFFFFSFFFFFPSSLPVVRCGAGLCVLGRQVCLGGAVHVVALCALAGVVWCWLLGRAVLCCLLVGLGVMLRWCCPCPAAWLAALWFGVVCLGVPLPCVAFCCAVLSCGGVLSCSAVCLRRCLCLLFVSCRCASAVCVLGCRAVCSLSCPFVVLCASSVLFLVAGVVAFWCRCLLLGVCWWLWLPGVVVWWCVSALVPVSGLAVAGRLPCGVLFPCAVSCGAVLPCGAVLWCPVFFFCFSPCWWRWFPVVPRWFWAPGRFRAVSVSVLRLCGAVLRCLRRCSLLSALLAGVWCCCLLCLCVCCWAWLSSVVSRWVLVATGVVSRWRAVVCPWMLCCAVLLRVLPPGVALLCAVLFRVAPFGAAARWVVSWGAVRRLGVVCLLAPYFVLSPRAVCVLLWCVAAWCCLPLCFVPCAPWGVVLCVSCRLCPVWCCCVARSPSVPCSSVLCPVVLCCRVVPWCPVLPPCWVCFLRGCGCTYLKNRCKIS